MSDLGPLVEALARAGYRVTEPRRAIAGLVAEQDGHFTAADLVSAAGRRRLGIGRATIFRALDLFLELNLLERLDLPSGDHAYVPCEPSHHHHVVCSACGQAREVDDSGIQSVVEEIERQTGFRIERHRLELFGVCPGCRGGRPRH
jgi:Fur family transcriptional regulator, ferric uptake regulator